MGPWTAIARRHRRHLGRAAGRPGRLGEHQPGQLEGARRLPGLVGRRAGEVGVLAAGGVGQQQVARIAPATAVEWQLAGGRLVDAHRLVGRAPGLVPPGRARRRVGLDETVLVQHGEVIAHARGGLPGELGQPRAGHRAVLADQPQQLHPQRVGQRAQAMGIGDVEHAGSRVRPAGGDGGAGVGSSVMPTMIACQDIFAKISWPNYSWQCCGVERAISWQAVPRAGDRRRGRGDRAELRRPVGRARSRGAVLARDLPPETTSAVAAALWYPYRALPRDAVTPGRRRPTRAEPAGRRGARAAESRSGGAPSCSTAPATTPWWRGPYPDSTR